MRCVPLLSIFLMLLTVFASAIPHGVHHDEKEASDVSETVSQGCVEATPTDLFAASSTFQPDIVVLQDPSDPFELTVAVHPHSTTEAAAIYDWLHQMGIKYVYDAGKGEAPQKVDIDIHHLPPPNVDVNQLPGVVRCKGNDCANIKAVVLSKPPHYESPIVRVAKIMKTDSESPSLVTASTASAVVFQNPSGDNGLTMAFTAQTGTTVAPQLQSSTPPPRLGGAEPQGSSQAQQDGNGAGKGPSRKGGTHKDGKSKHSSRKTSTTRHHHNHHKAAHKSSSSKHHHSATKTMITVITKKTSKGNAGHKKTTFRSKENTEEPASSSQLHKQEYRIHKHEDIVGGIGGSVNGRVGGRVGGERGSKKGSKHSDSEPDHDMGDSQKPKSRPKPRPAKGNKSRSRHEATRTHKPKKQTSTSRRRDHKPTEPTDPSRHTHKHSHGNKGDKPKTHQKATRTHEPKKHSRSTHRRSHKSTKPSTASRHAHNQPHSSKATKSKVHKTITRTVNPNKQSSSSESQKHKSADSTTSERPIHEQPPPTFEPVPVPTPEPKEDTTGTTSTSTISLTSTKHSRPNKPSNKPESSPGYVTTVVKTVAYPTSFPYSSSGYSSGLSSYSYSSESYPSVSYSYTESSSVETGIYPSSSIYSSYLYTPSASSIRSSASYSYSYSSYAPGSSSVFATSSEPVSPSSASSYSESITVVTVYASSTQPSPSLSSVSDDEEKHRKGKKSDKTKTKTKEDLTRTSTSNILVGSGTKGAQASAEVRYYYPGHGESREMSRHGEKSHGENKGKSHLHAGGSSQTPPNYHYEQSPANPADSVSHIAKRELDIFEDDDKASLQPRQQEETIMVKGKPVPKSLVVWIDGKPVERDHPGDEGGTSEREEDEDAWWEGYYNCRNPNVASSPKFNCPDARSLDDEDIMERSPGWYGFWIGQREHPGHPHSHDWTSDTDDEKDNNMEE